jgi:hypothetical protein
MGVTARRQLDATTARQNGVLFSHLVAIGVSRYKYSMFRRRRAVAKDPSILPSFRDLASFRLPAAVIAEQTARSRQLKESLDSLPGADSLRRLQEEGERRKREDEWRAQRRKQESELRALIAHAQRQIEAWRKVKEKGEAELAALIPAPRIESRTAALLPLPAQTADPQPADDPPPSILSTKGTRRNVAGQALSSIYPKGVPPTGPLLKKIVADVNDWIDADARENRHEPRHASPDTVSRALGRRK